MMSSNKLTVKPTSFLVSKSVRPFVVGHKKAGPLAPFIHYAEGTSFLTEIILQSRQIHNKASQTTRVSRLSVRLPKTKPGTRRVSIKAFVAQMGLWMQISVSLCGSFSQKAVASCRSSCLMKWAYVKEQIRILKAHLCSRVSVSHRICALVCFKTRRAASDGLTSGQPKSQLISVFLKLVQMTQNNNHRFHLKQPDFIALWLKVDKVKD